VALLIHEQHLLIFLDTPALDPLGFFNLAVHLHKPLSRGRRSARYFFHGIAGIRHL
jgi:hypothetical protein